MDLDTRRAAFEKLLASGTLSRIQRHVLELMRQYESGLTRNELDAMGSPGTPNAALSRRLVELERMGVLGRGEQRACSVTGRVCDVWKWTGVALPREVPEPPSRPTPGTIGKAVLDLREILAGVCGGKWDAFEARYPELVQVGKWLAAGAPSPSRAKGKDHGDRDQDGRGDSGEPPEPDDQHQETVQAGSAAGA